MPDWIHHIKETVFLFIALFVIGWIAGLLQMPFLTAINVPIALGTFIALFLAVAFKEFLASKLKF